MIFCEIREDLLTFILKNTVFNLSPKQIKNKGKKHSKHCTQTQNTKYQKNLTAL